MSDHTELTGLPPRTQPTVNEAHPDGTVRARRVEFCLGSRYAGTIIHVESNPDHVTFIDTDGVIIAEHPWPAPGITYIGIKQLHQPELSPMS